MDFGSSIFGVWLQTSENAVIGPIVGCLVLFSLCSACGAIKYLIPDASIEILPSKAKGLLLDPNFQENTKYVFMSFILFRTPLLKAHLFYLISV